MSKQITRTIVIVALQVMMMVTLVTGVFAADSVTSPATDAVAGTVITSISGHVWMDVNGSGNIDQAEATVGNVAVFVQRLDAATPDAEMTMVIYTDEVGGYSLEGLDAGTYQIWTESNSDSVYYLVVTVDAASPIAVVDLPAAIHTVFMPTIMR